MRWHRSAAFIACSALLLLVGCVQAEPRYEIAAYTASLNLKEGSNDVDVELDITYDVFEGVKSDGFKYVGTYEPVNLRGFDEAGKAVWVVLRRHRENQVYWTFPEVRSGKKRVVIRFTLRDVLATAGPERTLSAPWIGIFKVPVRRAEYRVIFPLGFSPKIHGATPGNSEKSMENGRLVLRWIQEPLTQKSVSVRFSQGDS